MTRTPTATVTATQTLTGSPTQTATWTGTVTLTPTATGTSTPLPLPTCLIIRPNGLGSFQTQNLATGCVDNWQCAQSEDGDASYVSSPPSVPLGPRTDVYALEDVTPQSGPISSVVVHALSRSASARGSFVATQLKVGANPTLFSGTGAVLPASYVDVQTLYLLNPANGLPWTWNDINGLQAGVRQQVAIGDEARTTSVFVSVCFPRPPASATPTPTVTETPAQGVGATRTATTTPTPTATPTPTPTAPTLTGTIRYYASDLPVPDVAVQLDGARNQVALTDGAGRYAFANLDAGPHVVEPSKMGGFNGAISVLDALRVLEARVEIRTLDRAQFLACDVNGDGTLSAVDAVRILQLAVQKFSRLPSAVACDSDWLFIPDPLVVPHQHLIQPQLTAQGCGQGAIVFEQLAAHTDGQDFRAVLLGDCDGDWQAAGFALPARSATAQTPRVRLGKPPSSPSRRLHVPLYVEAPASLQALEVQLRYDPKEWRLVGVSRAPAARNAKIEFAADGSGLLTIGLVRLQPIDSGRGAILTARFQRQGSRQPTVPVEVLRGAVNGRPAAIETE